MSLGGSIGNAVASFLRMIWAAIRSLLSKIWAFIKIILPIIIICVIIWCCPILASWLASVGAPSWLVSAVAWVGSYAAAVEAAAAYIWGAISAFGPLLVSLSTYLGFWGTLALIVGVCAYLAPDETQQFLEDLGVVIGDLITTVGGIVGSVLSPLLPYVLMAAGFWWFFLKDKDKKEQPLALDANGRALGGTYGR